MNVIFIAGLLKILNSVELTLHYLYKETHNSLTSFTPKTDRYNLEG